MFVNYLKEEPFSRVSLISMGILLYWYILNLTTYVVVEEKQQRSQAVDVLRPYLAGR